ncbi:hypothetical protein KBC80_03690 [Candidatus Woesebacteria bacterium]|nr:hypothetical protein [Candidatus Woesebacteria bacterium]
MKNKAQLTKEKKQTRMIQIIAALVLVGVLIAGTLSLVFYEPTPAVSSVITVCGRTGEFATLTSGTPVLYQGQVLAWLSFANGFVEISINNGAPMPIHPNPMANGDEANFRFIMEFEGQVFGDLVISGFACNGVFYYQLHDLQFIPSQNALMPNHEAIA